ERLRSRCGWGWGDPTGSVTTFVTLVSLTPRPLPRFEVELSYSSTLSSSFFLPQSAAACTKASTTGCGFFSLDDSCGWNNVATKNRCEGDSMARISPCGPRATTGNP